MRRFRIIGLALMALFALSAVTAAVVSAEEGVLTTLGGRPSTFQLKGGSATLASLGNSEFKCTAVTGNGVFLANSDVHGTATLDFTGCMFGGFATKSLGDASGTVLLKVLFLVCLIEPTKLLFGLLIQPTQTEHLEVPVAGILELVKGAVIAENLSGLKGDGSAGKVFKHTLKAKSAGDQETALSCKLGTTTFNHTLELALDSGTDEMTSEAAAFEIIYPAAVELMDS